MRHGFLLLIFFSVTSLLAEKQFDFASTPGKLPKNVRPIEYAVRIEPDLANLTFTGQETIKLKVEQPTREVVFNALEITISEARFDDKTLPASSIKLDPET